jgi:hypothetical protein
MVDLIAIGQGLNALKGASDLIKIIVGLRDSAKLLETTVDLNQQILSAQKALADAQTEQATLVETIRQREEEIARLKTWETEKQRYRLIEVAPGALAYVVKPQAQGSEPEHLICPTCYERAQKSVLQAKSPTEQRQSGGDIRTCPVCKTAVAVARNPEWKPSDQRRWP